MRYHLHVLSVIVLCTGLIGAAEWTDRPLASNVIMPQRHVFRPRPNPQPVAFTRVDVAVTIRDRMARTTLDVSLRNPSPRRQEAELLLPVPAGCAVVGLDFQGSDHEPSATLLPREEAERIYKQIVAQIRDPALMEFVGYNLVRSSVFPVEPGDTQKLRLVYEQLLESSGERVDYVLPRSESLAHTVPWHISVDIRDKGGVASVYSPSHELAQKAVGASVAADIVPTARREPGPFRLCYLRGSAAAASLVAYPDAKHGGGYFTFLAGSPATPEARDAIAREVQLVIDRSGSMHGEKLEQVREAAKQVIAGLEPGEAFNVVLYNHGVERFAEKPQVVSAASRRAARDWLDAMRPRGGTNLHDALFEALRQPATDGRLPVVLFLTDGIPTVGDTSEAGIRAMAEQHNPHGRRIFTFGVGLDVNSHLLEKLAAGSRAAASFVLPGQDIEVAVGETFERLKGPVLSDLALAVRDPTGGPVHGRVQDVSPQALGDLYTGQQVLVVGRYVGETPIELCVAGATAGGTTKELSVILDPAAASTVNGWVARLWAKRKIGVLVDTIRGMGTEAGTDHLRDPRFKELVDEIIRLSTEFGVLTEYTAFLARSGSLMEAQAKAEEAEEVLRRRAVGQRSGASSVAQEWNNDDRLRGTTLGKRNVFRDEELAATDAAGNVQTRADKAYYRRGRAWVDGDIVNQQERAGLPSADREVAFASEEYWALAEDLSVREQQSALANRGDIYLQVEDEVVLVRNPE